MQFYNEYKAVCNKAMEWINVDVEKQNKNTTQYVLDTTISKHK